MPYGSWLEKLWPDLDVARDVHIYEGRQNGEEKCVYLSGVRAKGVFEAGLVGAARTDCLRRSLR